MLFTSDAQFWQVPIIGTIKSICTLFNKRDINGTKPNFRIASLFGFDSESEHSARAPAPAIFTCNFCSSDNCSRGVNKILQNEYKVSDTRTHRKREIKERNQKSVIQKRKVRVFSAYVYNSMSSLLTLI